MLLCEIATLEILKKIANLLPMLRKTKQFAQPLLPNIKSVNHHYCGNPARKTNPSALIAEGNKGGQASSFVQHQAGDTPLSRQCHKEDDDNLNSSLTEEKKEHMRVNLPLKAMQKHPIWKAQALQISLCASLKSTIKN